MVTPLTPDDPDVLGDFRLAGRLGEGGQGVVYLARSASGEPVAVKLLNTGDKETRARLARELAAMESIASFCTARVLDVSTRGPRPYVVSEFVDGPSLADRVAERGPLRGGDLERLAVGTATALAAIHAAGIVHRDFKPSNVLLGPDGPRVVDFGIARAEGAATLTSGLIGTPAYLSPEQIAGSPASGASDVFAWAATMVFAATGASPFGADTVPAVLHRVLHAEPDLSVLPPRLRGVIGAALSKDPSRRPAAQALMVSLLDPNVRPGSPPPREPDVRPAREEAVTEPSRKGRLRGVLAIGAAVVVAAAATTAVLLLNRPPGTVTLKSSTPPATATATVSATVTSEEPATPAANGGVRIPAKFAGTWSGHTDSTNPLSADGADNTVELEAGRSEAAWTEKSAQSDCSATIVLTKVEASRLEFSLGASEGQCIPGTVWLELKGDSLAYTWRDVPGLGLVTQTGDLRKK